MITKFSDFINSIIIEELHPELKEIAASKSRMFTAKTKQSQIANKIKDLVSRGEKTGIEGNMPQGSSRAYMKHETPEDVHIDGHPAKMHVGTKVAFRSSLDKHHVPHLQGNANSLGAMQNEAEGGDHWVNTTYRTLEHKGGNHFESNEHGIFPPLLHHDHDNHEYSVVGHVESMKILWIH